MKPVGARVDTRRADRGRPSELGLVGWLRLNGFRLLLLVIMTSVAAGVGVALVTGNDDRPTAAAPVSVPTFGGPNAVPTVTTSAPAPDAEIARGTSAGYQAAVQVIANGTGATRTTVFAVELTVESEPASAPSAEAQLRGADGVVRPVKLQLTAAGHWVSTPVTLAPGKYTMTTRFNRSGGPLIIPVSLLVQ